VSRTRFAVALAVAASLVAAAPASALVNVRVNPAKPIVDDAITASFKVDRNLKPGYHWEALLLADSCGFASSFVHKVSKQKPKRGKVLTFRFSPYDDKLNGGSEWCQGKFGVSISTARDNDGKGGSLVGLGTGRFYGKP
jgi:hypothetical protein